MYRVGLEGILGLRRQGDHFTVQPCLPSDWPGVTLSLRHGRARYVIEIVRQGEGPVTLDGQPVADGRVPLQDDGREHRVRVVAPAPPGDSSPG
jgi:cellobiose phosphorylase